MKQPNKRKPVSVETYVKIHLGKMQKLYDEGIVTDDTLAFEFKDAPNVTLIGAVKFGGSVELKVEKYLKIERHGRSKCLVTKLYSYECHIAGQSKSDIFRYDNNPHDEPYPGHDTPHHLHRYDPPGKQLKGYPTSISEDCRPFLDDVIREAYKEAKRRNFETVPTVRRGIAAKPRIRKRKNKSSNTKIRKNANS